MKQNLFVSNHARLRMLERMGCRETKIDKICNKAWRSNEYIDPNLIYRKKEILGYKNGTYRLFSGLIFVFADCKENKFDKILITVYNPKKFSYKDFEL